MPFSPQTIEEKPYNMCINCIHIGKRCDGPNFLAMEIERWCDWCKLRKEYLGWTNSYIAEEADVSKISVDRIMTANVKDLRISTMQAVTKMLVNGSWGQYPCAMAAIGTDTSEAAAQCANLKEEMSKLKAAHKEEIAAIRADHEQKINFWKEQMKFLESQMLAKDKLLETITNLIDKGRT